MMAEDFGGYKFKEYKKMTVWQSSCRIPHFYSGLQDFPERGCLHNAKKHEKEKKTSWRFFLRPFWDA